MKEEEGRKSEATGGLENERNHGSGRTDRQGRGKKTLTLEWCFRFSLSYLEAARPAPAGKVRSIWVANDEK